MKNEETEDEDFEDEVVDEEDELSLGTSLKMRKLRIRKMRIWWMSLLMRK